MSNFDAKVVITADDSNFQAALARDRKALADFAAEAEATRRVVIHQLSVLNQSISYVFQMTHIAARAVGKTLTPLQNALMGVISGTTSLLLSTAAAMESTVVLAPIGVALTAFTLGWQIEEFARLSGVIEQIRRDVAEAMSIRRTTPRRVIVGVPF